MSDAAFVMDEGSMISDAQRRLRLMIKDEMRSPGDAGSALRRIVERHKLRMSRIHTLLYRDPNDISAQVYFSICRAYEAELARQEQIFARRRAGSQKAKTRLGAALLRMADALDGGQSADLTDAGRQESAR